jgi:hypothetical protein
VYDLDEPTMVPANGVDDVFWALRGVMAALGFHYLKLRAIRAKIGTLEAQVAALPSPVPVPASHAELDVERTASAA